MENEKNNLTSFNQSGNKKIDRAPKAINNTPFMAIPDDEGMYQIAIGKYIILEGKFKTVTEAAKAIAKNKWQIWLNTMAVVAGIQIKNALEDKASERGGEVKTNKEEQY